MKIFVRGWVGIGMQEGWTLLIYLDGFAEIPWKSVPFIMPSLCRDVKKYFLLSHRTRWMEETKSKKEMRMEKGKNSSSLFYDYSSDKYDGSRE